MHVEAQLGPAASIYVQGDAGRLQQVFWNLLKNAIKFTSAGGEIVVRSRLDSDGFITTEVQDNGVGMDPAILPRIFDAFEQGSPDITRAFGGLGLGLAICHAVVEKHGGTPSPPPATAPARERASPSACSLKSRFTPNRSPPTRPRPTGTPSRSAPAPLRILLVEDHCDTAKVSAATASACLAGHRQIPPAMSPPRCGKATGPDAFDLVISDLGLPDGTGFDFMRELRRRGSKIPGIALSGYGQEEDVRRSLEAGFAVHLTKPTNPDRLVETIAARMANGTPAAV